MPDGNFFPLSSGATSLSPFYDNGFDQYVSNIVNSGASRDQWLRKVTLIVSTGGGEGIDLSNMRIVFSQKKSTNATPNLLNAKVYNLSQNTINRIISSTNKLKASRTIFGEDTQSSGQDFGGGGDNPEPEPPAPEESALRAAGDGSPPEGGDDTGFATDTSQEVFDTVTLSAGYQKGRFGVIFDGTVFQYVIGKETAVDSYLEIWAGDEDVSINFATINKSLPEGTTVQGRIDACVDELVKLGAKKGKIDAGEFGKTPSLRGVVLTGMVRDRLNELTGMFNADWYIDDGKVYILRRQDYKEGTAAYLSPKTGLIGMPQTTPQGIQIKCLLNPALQLGGLVKVDSDVITGIPYIPGADLQKNSSGVLVPVSQNQSLEGQDQFRTRGEAITRISTFTSPTSPVGLYKIFYLEHSGDTRGNTYYSEMICLALDAQGKVISAGGDIMERTGIAVDAATRTPET